MMASVSHYCRARKRIQSAPSPRTTAPFSHRMPGLVRIFSEVSQSLMACADPPGKLRAQFRTNAMPLFRWAGIKGHVGYFVQLGDGTPQGWGPPIACPKAKYEPLGLTLGQKIAVRVAVQRRSGMSNWSDALLVTVH